MMKTHFSQGKLTALQMQGRDMYLVIATSAQVEKEEYPG
jgi:hypothetical protein